jgi:hypothetical protein
MAGWCDRHGLQKTDSQWKLCQTRDNYRKAWDEGRLHGQAGCTDPAKEAKRAQLRERVAKRVANSNRLLDWAKFFRHEGEVGLGDTLSRLKEESKGRRDLRRLISSAISKCACNETESIRRLNEQHRYQQPMHQ